MKSFFFIATSLLGSLFLTSCKQNDIQIADEIASFGAVKVPKEKVYTPSEVAIGRRICGALKNKRELFETVTDMKEKFRVRGELTNCTQTAPFNIFEFNVAISNVSPSDLEYVAEVSRPNYFKDVITDTTGALNIVCSNLATSDSVSNQTLSGSSYFLVSFMIEQGYDKFTVIRKNRDNAGNYNVVSSEAVSVITQANQAAPKFFGVEKERIRYSACSTPKVFSSVKQTWITAITSF